MSSTSKTRNLIFVVSKDPRLNEGGYGSYVRAFGRAAIQAGYQPHLFGVGDASSTESTPFGVLHVTKSPFRPIRGLMVAVHGPYIVRSIDRFVVEHGGHCLIHSFGTWGGVAADAARRLERRGSHCTVVSSPFDVHSHETRAKLRGVAREHGLWRKLQLGGELLWSRLTVDPSERRGLRRSDAVLVSYESVRSIIERQHGQGMTFRRITYSPETAFVNASAGPRPLPGPIDALAAKHGPLILAVSRHDPRKGLDVLLHALARLGVEGVAFRACLVSAGELLNSHRTLADRLGLSGCTALPGRVPDVSPYLEHADIFALPSYEEGTGSVSLLEAMHAGVAPVVSRVDGLPEDVTDGESALLVEPRNVVELTRALRALIEDPGLRSRIADGARAAFQARFSPKAFVRDIRSTYASLGFPPVPHA